MFGDGVGDLRVETKDSENGYLWNTTWSISGNQGKFWNPASITVDGSDYVASKYTYQTNKWKRGRS